MTDQGDSNGQNSHPLVNLPLQQPTAILPGLIGQEFRGYKFTEIIGWGGLGAVFRADDTNRGREVAVKIVLPVYAQEANFKRRFEREKNIIAKLEHPHIIPLYDHWEEDDGRIFLVMRLVRGGNVKDSLKNGAWPLQRIARLVDQIAGALTLAHQQKIVHRDIKPSNILLDEAGNAYLADFGIAKDLRSQESLTEVDVVIGTADYMSPEQINGDPITPQADQYSLGILLYELITGQHPFQTGAQRPQKPMMYLKHLHEPMPSIRQYDLRLPTAIDACLQRMTQKQPAERYSSMFEAGEALKHALETPLLSFDAGEATDIVSAKQPIHRLPSRSEETISSDQNASVDVVSKEEAGSGGDAQAIPKTGPEQERPSTPKLDSVGERTVPPETPVVGPTEETLRHRIPLLGREAELAALKHDILNHKNVALWGPPGIGKTRLMQEIATDPDVRRHFSDRILWVSIGPDDDPQVLSKLKAWAQDLIPDFDVASAMQAENPIEELRTTIQRVLDVNQPYLLCIDDVWNVQSAQMFYLGKSHVHVYTSRLRDVLRELRTRPTQLRGLTVPQTLDLFKMFLPSDIVKEFTTSLTRLGELVGNISLALLLIASTLEESYHDELDGVPGARLQQQLEQLITQADKLLEVGPVPELIDLLEETGTPISEQERLVSGIAITYNSLDWDQKFFLQALSAFLPGPNAFSLVAAAFVGSINHEEGQSLIRRLWDRGFVEYDPQTDRYSLHQTVATYVQYQRLLNLAWDITCRKQFVRFFGDPRQSYFEDYGALKLERENIKKALKAAAEQDDVREQLQMTLTDVFCAHDAIGKRLYQHGDLDWAREHLDEGIVLAEHHLANLPEGVSDDAHYQALVCAANILYQRAAIDGILGRFDEAYARTEQSLDKALQARYVPGEVRALIQLGIASLMKGEFDTGEEHLTNVLRVAYANLIQESNAGDEKPEEDIRHNVAYAHQTLSQLKLDKALALTKDGGSDNVAEALRILDEASEEAQKGLNMALEPRDDPRLIGMCYSSLGEILRHQAEHTSDIGQCIQAMAELDKAQEAAESIDDPYIALSSLQLFAEAVVILLKQGQKYGTISVGNGLRIKDLDELCRNLEAAREKADQLKLEERRERIEAVMHKLCGTLSADH